jgi:NADH dehydrogenase/NADH:ubiquinone oxidoreductase subunit G
MFKNWLFFLDNDEECNILNDNFYDYYDFDLILYQGHHGDRKSNIADLILPSVYPFEKNSSFINIMGNYKYIKYIYKYGNNLSDARVDWKILNMLFFLFKGVFIKEIDNLKYKYIPLNLDKNLLLNLDKIYYKVLLYNRGILNYKDDFYLTDNITKASLILTLTSSRIKKRNNN